MNRSQRLVVLAITVLPVLVLIVSSLLCLHTELDRLSRHADGIIGDELQLRFGRRVHVGSANLSNLGTAVISDVRVYKGHSADSGILVSAGKIVVRYSWRALLGGKGASAVSQVHVSRPRVELVRRPDGSFNVADLLKPVPGPPKPPFRGVVDITAGEVAFLDYAVTPGHPRPPVLLHSVAGTLRARDYPTYAFTGDARGSAGQFVGAAFRGRYHSRSNRVVVEIDARNASAPLIVPYAWKSRAVQVYAGKLDLAVRVDEKRTDGRYRATVAGTVGVYDASVRLSSLRAPVTGVTGSLLIAPDSGTANLVARFLTTPLRVSGTFTDFAKPAVDLVVVSNSADFRSFVSSASFLSALSGFSPGGRGPVLARVTGSLASPRADVTATVPTASIQGVPVGSVRVSALYQPGRIDLRSVRLMAKGASVSASGSVSIGHSSSVNLRGQFSDLNLKLFSAAAGYPVTGLASGSYTLTGPTANPRAAVTLQARDGSVEGTRFGRASAVVTIANSRAQISKLQITGIAGGSISVPRGAVSSTSLDLEVSAEGINIGQVTRRFGLTGYSGTAFFTGRITGTPRAPQVEGSLEAFDATVGDSVIDYARAVFSGNRRTAAVTEGLIQVYPAEVAFSGDLTGLDTNRVGFSGRADVQRLEVTRLLDLLERHVGVTGTILGEFTFSGAFLPRAPRGAQKLVNVDATGILSLEDATAFGYPVTSASARLDYSNDLLEISDAAVVSDGARLTLTDGTVNTATRAVYGEYTLAGFELSRLQEYVGDYLVLAGTSTASGTVSGSWNDVVFSVDASADGPALNYQRFDRAEAHFTYAGGKFATYRASIAKGTQRLDLSGSNYDPETACTESVKGIIADVSVPDTWDLLVASPRVSTPEISQELRRLPRITSGRINGSFELSGCLKDPDGRVDLTATNIGLDVERIDSVELRASAKAGAVSLDTFRVLSEDMTLEARPMEDGSPAFKDGNLNLEVRAENVRLARLEPWLKGKTPGGTLSALFTIQGPSGAPDVTGSVEVVRPSYDGLLFDQLRASLIQLTSSRVEIPDVLLTARGHQASGTISLPWDWRDFSISLDEPIEVSADLGRQNLAVLNILAPVVDAKMTTAEISEAWFRMEGTLLDPQLSGSVKAIGGNIAFVGFSNTFNNVNLDLAFVGDRIAVNSLSAASSLGGSIQILPGAYITSGLSGPGTVALQLVANQLVVAEKNVLGLKEDVKTQIDTALSVTGPLSSLTIADGTAAGVPGGVAFSKGRLAFQATAGSRQWGGLAAINPSFNVSLRIGQNVVIAPPNMSLAVTGSGVLTGTLANPVINRMGLDVLSGEMALATARLRLVPGGKIYLSYAPPAEPDVQIDLRATASVFAVNSLNQRQRYQITMTIFGQAAAPQISLSSSPPGLTREQMLAGLGHLPNLFGSPEAGLQQEIGGILTAAGAAALFAPIENLFIEKFGFEQFSLEFSPMYPLSLYVSRQLFDNVYIGLSRQLRAALASTSNVWYTVYLSYRRGSWEYSISVDDQQTSGAQISFIKAFW